MYQVGWLTAFYCVCCELSTDFINYFGIFIVDFEQVYANWESLLWSRVPLKNFYDYKLFIFQILIGHAAINKIHNCRTSFLLTLFIINYFTDWHKKSWEGLQLLLCSLKLLIYKDTKGSSPNIASNNRRI